MLILHRPRPSVRPALLALLVAPLLLTACGGEVSATSTSPSEEGAAPSAAASGSPARTRDDERKAEHERLVEEWRSATPADVLLQPEDLPDLVWDRRETAEDAVELRAPSPECPAESEVVQLAGLAHERGARVEVAVYVPDELREDLDADDPASTTTVRQTVVVGDSLDADDLQRLADELDACGTYTEPGPDPSRRGATVDVQVVDGPDLGEESLYLFATGGGGGFTTGVWSGVVVVEPGVVTSVSVAPVDTDTDEAEDVMRAAVDRVEEGVDR